MKTRVHLSDLVHEVNEAGTAIRLSDADGDHLGTLPVGFTDAQIQAAVRFANEWFGQGFESGRLDAQAQIRAAIGLAN